MNWICWLATPQCRHNKWWNAPCQQAAVSQGGPAQPEAASRCSDLRCLAAAAWSSGECWFGPAVEGLHELALELAHHHAEKAMPRVSCCDHAEAPLHCSSGHPPSPSSAYAKECGHRWEWHAWGDAHLSSISDKCASFWRHLQEQLFISSLDE